MSDDSDKPPEVLRYAPSTAHAKMGWLFKGAALTTMLGVLGVGERKMLERAVELRQEADICGSKIALIDQRQKAAHYPSFYPLVSTNPDGQSVIREVPAPAADIERMKKTDIDERKQYRHEQLSCAAGAVCAKAAAPVTLLTGAALMAERIRRARRKREPEQGRST